MADQHPPKRPLNPFFIFLKEHRQQISSENSNMKVSQVTKKAGEMWRSLPDKSKWEKQAAKMKDQYEIDVKEFEERDVNGTTSSGMKTKENATVPKQQPKKKA